MGGGGKLKGWSLGQGIVLFFLTENTYYTWGWERGDYRGSGSEGQMLRSALVVGEMCAFMTEGKGGRWCGGVDRALFVRYWGGCDQDGGVCVVSL